MILQKVVLNSSDDNQKKKKTHVEMELHGNVSINFVISARVF